MNIHFTASEMEDAQIAPKRLIDRYGQVALDKADIIVALGGDGFMLETMHTFMTSKLPIYGMNKGTIGFLLNSYREEGLIERLESGEITELHPL